MADHRHKRDTNARRFKATTVAGPLAVLATAGAVTLGVLVSEPSVLTAAAPSETVSDAASAVPASVETDLPTDLIPSLPAALARNRASSLDRSFSRVAPTRTERLLAPKAVKQAIEHADEKRWTTTALNLWDGPDDKAQQDGELAAGEKVLLTGRTAYGREEIVTGPKQTRWVTTGYVSDTKPVGPDSPLSTAPCPDSSVENGLVPSAVLVYRAVCHAFPQITTYGGYSPRGEHASGKAIDIMTTDPALLTQIGDFLQAHASELDLYDIIRLQHIWTPVRAAEGWRAMPDRGSPTANHMDHVHVSTN